MTFLLVKLLTIYFLRQTPRVPKEAVIKQDRSACVCTTFCPPCAKQTPEDEPAP